MDKAASDDLTMVDLRGLMCPEPVLRTKKLLDDQRIKRIEALVSDEINLQNLERLARSHKLAFDWQASGDFFRVIISRAGASEQPNGPGADKATDHVHQGQSPQSSLALKGASANQVGTVIFINKDTFGEGEADFSKNLLNIFLQSLLQTGHKPKAILLANSGVKLLAANSSFSEVLKNFAQQGSEVLACGLCVEFYGLEKDIAKEQITNMFAICEYLFAADKVISP